MSRAYFITGTDTEIGKTHSAVRLIERWRGEGLRVAAMKPVASGCTLGADGELLNFEERAASNEAIVKLCSCTQQSDAAAIVAATEALNAATSDFAARRMDKAVQKGLSGHKLDEIG